MNQMEDICSSVLSVDDVLSTGYTPAMMNELAIKIQEVSKNIHEKNLNGEANVILVHPRVWQVVDPVGYKNKYFVRRLKSLPKFKVIDWEKLFYNTRF